MVEVLRNAELHEYVIEIPGSLWSFSGHMDTRLPVLFTSLALFGSNVSKKA